MSQEHVEIVRRCVDALDRRDFDAALKYPPLSGGFLKAPTGIEPV
jgi:hypothetical protein